MAFAIEAVPFEYDGAGVEGVAATNATAATFLPRKSGRALAANAAAGGVANLLKIGIQLIMLPVMAHLLGPGEFGIYALALPAITFFTALADAGMGQALAREAEESSSTWSTAFWLMLLLGAGLAVVVAGWGMMLSFLAHEPRVQGLMIFLSISLPLITLSVSPTARLTRSGRLAILAAADLGSTVVGAGLALTLALAGGGAWSLAAQYVVGFAVRATILNAAAFVRPTLEFEFGLVREHLVTGVVLISGRLCEFAGRLVENICYGRAFGAAALGSFAFANQAPKFICEAASGPAWGALYSVALREPMTHTVLTHKRLLYLLSAAVFPAAFLLSASAAEVIPAVLGPSWASAAPLFQILIPFYALSVVSLQGTALLLASKQSRYLLYFAVANAVLRLAAVVGGSLLGQYAVAAGIGGALTVCAIAAFVVAAKVLGPEFSPWREALGGPVLASTLACAVCYLLLRIPHFSPLTWTAASCAFGGLTYVVALYLIDKTRCEAAFRHLMSLARPNRAAWSHGR